MKDEGGRRKGMLLRLESFYFIVAAFGLHPYFSFGAGGANL
jgi:hypothetical protein